MQRGQQERLPVMAAEAFEATGISPRDLSHIGVTLGPGSFTGVRVGLSFAKGLAVALGLKLQGIGTLEGLGHHPQLLRKNRLAVIDGGRGRLYVQHFRDGFHDAPRAIEAGNTGLDADILTGPAAALLAPHIDAEVFDQPWPDLSALNALARVGGHDDVTPLYMRDADAVASTRGIITLGA
jgi:tRNA threonylcarbamoyladenosine biosynthesis protein TsaB